MAFDFKNFGGTTPMPTSKKGGFDFNSFGQTPVATSTPVNTATQSSISQLAGQEATKPIVPYTGKEGVIGYTAGVLANTPQSAGKFVSGVGHIVTHPVETVKSIGGLVKGLGAGAGEYILDNTDIGQKILEKAQEVRKANGVAPLPVVNGKITTKGSDVENDPQLKQAKSVGDYLSNRYGSIENVKKSFKEDPVGVAFDIASVFSGGEGILSKSANVAEKAGLTKTSNTLSKASEISGNIATKTNPLTYGAKAVKPIISKAFPTETQKVQQVDDNMRKIFSNVTGDATKIEEEAHRAKLGLDLLQKESGSLTVPDTKAPLGSGVVKPFDIKKATPNEFITSINQMGTKIAETAKNTAKLASEQKYKLDTTEAHNIISKAVENGDIPASTADRLSIQIANLDQDPLKIHNWVESVNAKYGNKYEKGTIHDTALSDTADKVAKSLRTQLNSILDRTGYAEAYRNNQTLKKAFLGIAKKANKKVDFGNLATDAGIDSAFAILTSNPIYLSRTVASGSFRFLQNYLAGQKTFNTIKKTAGKLGKIESGTSLPSSDIKKGGALQNYSEDAIKPTMDQTTISPNIKTDGITKPQNTKANITDQNPVISKLSNKTVEKSSGVVDKVKNLLKDQRGAVGYKETGNLTTKILKDLEGKTTVSKQYILDATNRGELKQAERDLTRNVLDTMKGDTINVKEFADKVKQELLPLKVKSSVPEYAMSHRPSKTGAIASDISKNGEVIPKDVYDHPEWYANMKEKTYQESFAILKKIRGSPNAEITIYRSSPKKELNHGDWVTLSKTYAKEEGLRDKIPSPVHSYKVKAKDIQFAGDDINEFGYYPEK